MINPKTFTYSLLQNNIYVEILFIQITRTIIYNFPRNIMSLCLKGTQFSIILSHLAYTLKHVLNNAEFKVFVCANSHECGVQDLKNIFKTVIPL